MRLKLFGLLFMGCALSSGVKANVDNGYATEFKGAKLQACDTVFHKVEDSCPNMICRDILINAWAECWKKSMNTELNKRLLTLKDSDALEFNAEMNLQKNFNAATQKLCGKNCGSGGTMKGIPYNFCRVDAYKYRTDQAILINKHELTINSKEPLNKSHKEKDTAVYNLYLDQMCKMPINVWRNGIVPANCKDKAYKEIDYLRFTDDVCNLS